MLHRSLHPRRALRAPPAAPAASALSALHPAPARPAAGGTGSPQPVPRAARSARGLVLRLGLGCCRTDHRGDTRHHSGWRPSCRRHRFPPGLARPSGNRSSESADLRKLGGATLWPRRSLVRAVCAGSGAKPGRTSNFLERLPEYLPSHLLVHQVVQEPLPSSHLTSITVLYSRLGICTVLKRNPSSQFWYICLSDP